MYSFNLDKNGSPKNIYPDVKIIEKKIGKNNNLMFETYLVKKHCDKYYYWHIMFRFNTDKEIDNKLQLLNRFHQEVYLKNILGVVDTKSDYIELADEQISEVERLKKLNNLK